MTHQASIQVSAFAWVPDFARGFVKDLRVRWALEEAGLAYQPELLSGEDQNSPSYRQRQPFGQVPAYKDADVELFESGAIVMYLARKSEALAPRDEAGQARVLSWILAALNSIEPHIVNYVLLDLFYKEEPWSEGRKPSALAMAKRRLECLSNWLGDKEYLEGRFTAGDLLMTTVLRDADSGGLLEGFANLSAYKARCEARPAFKRALAAQARDYEAHAPAA